MMIKCKQITDENISKTTDQGYQQKYRLSDWLRLQGQHPIEWLPQWLERHQQWHWWSVQKKNLEIANTTSLKIGSTGNIVWRENNYFPARFLSDEMHLLSTFPRLHMYQVLVVATVISYMTTSFYMWFDIRCTCQHFS